MKLNMGAFVHLKRMAPFLRSLVEGAKTAITPAGLWSLRARVPTIRGPMADTSSVVARHLRSGLPQYPISHYMGSQLDEFIIECPPHDSTSSPYQVIEFDSDHYVTGSDA